ncbi:MAG: ATP-binding cassette domain-containing protein [Desulfovibrionaceae bacterium]|jgi:phospholipid/cholesterol/gamma-HCH transport system ATP-binding protein|nr:ATP-binding cassette domain-containing protein [Desulfovibrionaceae bacterium]
MGNGEAKKAQAWDIRLEDLSVGYEEKVVLSGVNAVLPAGRITMILGGSGHGKSTLLRHMLGLNRPSRGRIVMGGRDLFALDNRDFRRARRRIGVLFQDGALLGSMTLGQNVGLPLKEHTGLDKRTIEEVVRYKLELVGLEEFYDYYPSQLSGGMRKRAGLARAIVMDPPIIFCDEPTSGLDPINSAQMDQLLLDTRRRYDVTIVVVSHDLESLRSIAEHVLVVNDGKLAFQGSIDELRATGDPYLRRFLERRPEPQSEPPVFERQAEIAEALAKAFGE